MFTSYNYIQIKCRDCNKSSDFHPGIYEVIKCKHTDCPTNKPKPTRKRKAKDNDNE